MTPNPTTSSQVDRLSAGSSAIVTRRSRSAAGQSSFIITNVNV
jgi:hypothetical protein